MFGLIADISFSCFRCTQLLFYACFPVTNFTCLVPLLCNWYTV